MTAIAVFLLFAAPMAELHPRAAVDHWAKVWMIPTQTAHRMAWAESLYRTDAVSPSDARGLFQVLHRDDAWVTGRYAPGRYDWRSASDSARVGLGYLAGLRSRFGSLRRGVMAYHMGPTALARGVVPGPRTMAYVAEVMP